MHGGLQRLGAPAVASIAAIEFVTLGALVVPIFVGLPVHVAAIRPRSWSPEDALSVVTSVGAGSALVANIAFGWLGDRTRRRLRGRSAWIAFGALTGAGSVAMTAHAAGFAAVVVWWALAQACYNAAFAGVLGAIADLAPAGDRTRVSGWWAAAASASIVVSLGIVTFLAKTTFVLFDLVPVLSLPVVAVAAWVLHRATPATRPVVDEGAATDAVLDPAQPSRGWRRRFATLLVQCLFTQLAYSCATLYGVYYLVRRIALSTDHAATVASATVAASGAVAVVAAVAGARWATRRGRPAPIMAAGVAAILGGLVLLAAGTRLWTYVAALGLTGLGYGMYGAADIGLVIRTVPRAQAGRYLGIFNVARTLPQSLAPSIGPVLLAIGSGDVLGDDRSQDFTAFYLISGVFALIALAALLVVRGWAAEPVVPAIGEVA